MPIYIASRYGRFKVNEKFLEAGTDVNIVRKDGWIPVIVASNHGQLEVLNRLPQTGVDAN